MRVARIALLGLAIVGCSDSTGVDVSDLVGSWVATSAVFEDATGTFESVDLVAEGYSLELEVRAGGAVTLDFSVGDFTQTETGTIMTSGNEVTLTLDNVSTGTIEVSGDRMTMDLVTGVEWDFDEDGFDEPATAVIVFREN